jgi:FtsP/CotA-like multicopper oxidase with cupredoxin domain
MRRGRFLRAGTSMAVAALAPAGARAAGAAVVDYTLTARSFAWRAAPGVTTTAFGYDGQVPGPLLRVTHGQRVRVRYVNRCGEPTSIHWHGMILPNAMDGVAGITQPAVENGGTFEYEFAPGPPGTRWYHDHAGPTAVIRGLFGMFVVEDPRDEPADAEFSVVLHDVARLPSIDAAMHGTSDAPMLDPMDSPEMTAMHPGDRMGDEVAYAAHAINGATYPQTKPLIVRVGQRVRLRVLNANQTQTRYVRLAGHPLLVTHADGNPLQTPVSVDILRLGVAERLDAWFEVRQPGAWLLHALTSDPLSFEQAVLVCTPGMEHASPLTDASTLGGATTFTYPLAGAPGTSHFVDPSSAIRKQYVLEGGDYASMRWTMNDQVWPHTEKILVRRGDDVVVRFTNNADMDHPMHLHGHTFELVEFGGRALRRPLAKDTTLVPANGGTVAWRFRATSPPGRWLLHCHNQIHMMDGMMTEVVYRGP